MRRSSSMLPAGNCFDGSAATTAIEYFSAKSASCMIDAISGSDLRSPGVGGAGNSGSSAAARGGGRGRGLGGDQRRRDRRDRDQWQGVPA